MRTRSSWTCCDEPLDDFGRVTRRGKLHVQRIISERATSCEPHTIMARFRLWHSVDARSLRILWTFEELGLKRGRDYVMQTLPFPPRQHRPEFLEKKNVLGTVPYFEHYENAMLRASMTESCAVALYVAKLHECPNLTIRENEQDHGAFLNWLFHADATLTFPQSVVMRYGVFEPGIAEAAADGCEELRELEPLSAFQIVNTSLIFR